MIAEETSIEARRAKIDQLKMDQQEPWEVIQVSAMAERTVNPIRRVVDASRIKPNPEKRLMSLGLGDPTVFGNLNTHPEVTKAIIKQVETLNNNGYPLATGSMAAKEAIAKRYTSAEAPITAHDVYLSSGCSGALELAIGVLAHGEGDTVLLPQPGFTIYGTICRSKGINVVYYPLRPDSSWEADLTAMREIIASLKGQTRIAAWLINNPSNPCGSVYSREHLLDCLGLAQEFRVPIISDEIYEDMVFKGHQYVPLRSLSKSVPVLTVSGISKRFLVPGWRLGWIILHDCAGGSLSAIREGLTNLCGLILGPNSLVQAALPDIFANVPASFYEDTNRILETNAKVVAEALEGIPGISFIRPQGAMYAMIGIDISLYTGFSDDREFTEALHREESVICLPGVIFGMPNYFRIVYCGPEEMVQEACQRIRAFCLAHLKGQ